MREALRNPNIDDELRTLLVWGIISKSDRDGGSTYRISGKFIKHWFPLVEVRDLDSSSFDNNTLKMIQDTLAQAFVLSELDQLIFYGFNKRLDNIVSLDGSIPDVVFRLVQWAARRNQLKKLVEAALKEKPNLVSLKRLLDSL